MFSDKLKVLRNNKGLTQSELAQHLGVTQQAVGRWEKGLTSPDYETLKLLASFFNVSTDYLLGRETTTGTNDDIDGLSQFLLENLFKDDPESRAKLKSIKVDGTFSDAGITYPLSDESLKLVEDAIRVAFKTGELKGRICVEIDE